MQRVPSFPLDSMRLQGHYPQQQQQSHPQHFGQQAEMEKNNKENSGEKQSSQLSSDFEDFRNLNFYEQSELYPNSAKYHKGACSDQSRSASSSQAHQTSSEEDEGVNAHCIFCSKFRSCNSFGSLLNKALYSKYSSSQNYFYSKDINDIIAGASTSLVIQFNDLEVLSEDQEYLKRWYPTSHQRHKLEDLTEYYKYHKDIPRLFMANQAHTMNRFHDKRRRIEYHRIKVQLNLEPDEPSESSEESSRQDESEEENPSENAADKNDGKKKKKQKVTPPECHDLLKQLDVTLTFHERQKQTIQGKKNNKREPEPYSTMNPYFLKKQKDEAAKKTRKKTGFDISSVLAKPSHTNFFAEVVSAASGSSRQRQKNEKISQYAHHTDSSTSQLSQIIYKCDTRQDFLASEHSIPHLHSVLYDQSQNSFDSSYLQSYQQGDNINDKSTSLNKSKRQAQQLQIQRPQGVIMADKNLNFQKKQQQQPQFYPNMEEKKERAYSQYTNESGSQKLQMLPVSTKLTSIISEQQKIHQLITQQLKMRGSMEQTGAVSTVSVALSLSGVVDGLSANLVKKSGTMNNMNGSASTSAGSATNNLKNPSFSHSGGNLKNEQSSQSTYTAQMKKNTEGTSKSQGLHIVDTKNLQKGKATQIPSVTSSNVSSKADLSSEKRYAQVGATSVENSLNGTKSLLRNSSPSQYNAATNFQSDNRSKKTQIMEILSANRGSKDLLLLSSPLTNNNIMLGQLNTNQSQEYPTQITQNVAISGFSSRNPSSPIKKKKSLSINNNGNDLQLAQHQQIPHQIQSVQQVIHKSSVSPPSREILYPQHHETNVIVGSNSRASQQKYSGNQQLSNNYQVIHQQNVGDIRLKKKKEQQIVSDSERVSQNVLSAFHGGISSQQQNQMVHLPLKQSEIVDAHRNSASIVLSSARSQSKSQSQLSSSKTATTARSSTNQQVASTINTHFRQNPISNLVDPSQITSKRNLQNSQTPIGSMLLNMPPDTVKAQQFMKTQVFAQSQLLKARSSSNPKQINHRNVAVSYPTYQQAIQPSPLPLGIISSSNLNESKLRLMQVDQQLNNYTSNDIHQTSVRGPATSVIHTNHQRQGSSINGFVQHPQPSMVTLSRKSSHINLNEQFFPQAPWESSSQDEDFGNGFIVPSSSNQLNSTLKQQNRVQTKQQLLQQPASMQLFQQSQKQSQYGTSTFTSGNQQSSLIPNQILNSLLGSANIPQTSIVHGNLHSRTRSQELLQTQSSSSVSNYPNLGVQTITNRVHPTSPANPSPAPSAQDYQKFQIQPRKPCEQNRLFASNSHHSGSASVNSQSYNSSRPSSTHQYHKSGHVSSAQSAWKQNVSPIQTVRNGSFSKTNGVRVDSSTARVSNIASLFDSTGNHHQISSVINNNYVGNINYTSGCSSAFSSGQFGSQNPTIHTRKNSNGTTGYYSSPPATSQQTSDGGTFTSMGSQYSNPSSFFIMKSQSSSNQASQDHANTSGISSPPQQATSKQTQLQPQQQTTQQYKREAVKQKIQIYQQPNPGQPRTNNSSPSQKIKSIDNNINSLQSTGPQTTQLNLFATSASNPTKNSATTVPPRTYSKASSLIRFRQPNIPY